MIEKMEESYLFTYANGCIYKLGLLGERVVNGDLCRLDAAVTKNDYMQVDRASGRIETVNGGVSFF